MCVCVRVCAFVRACVRVFLWMCDSVLSSTHHPHTGGSLKSMEESYVKKFQSYQDMAFKEGSKIKVSKEERKRLKKQLKDGKLHEEMLNRRSKMKADKFCK